MSKAPRVSHRAHAACLRSGLCVPMALQEQLEAMLGDHAVGFDFLHFYEQADAERIRNRWVIDSVWQLMMDAFRAEVRLRGWSTPRPRFAGAKPLPDKGQTMQRIGYVYPCPHAPSCPNTWSCCKKQLQERDE